MLIFADSGGSLVWLPDRKTVEDMDMAMAKLKATEVLAMVADEALQIHGGYGFTEEFTPARGSRDARINRIFEGTNEIMRLIVVRELLGERNS